MAAFYLGRLSRCLVFDEEGHPTGCQGFLDVAWSAGAIGWVVVVAAVKATERIQRVHQGKRQRQGDRGPGLDAGLVDLALLQVMRDSLLRRAEAVTLRWGDVKVHADGSGRLHVVRSKTDQTAEGVVLYWGQAAVEALPAIRPEEAVIDPAASVFGLSANQISRRIKAATKMAGLEVWPESGLAGFRATSISRITGLTGIIIYVIRFNNPLLHRYSMSRKQQLEENRGFRPDF